MGDFVVVVDDCQVNEDFIRDNLIVEVEIPLFRYTTKFFVKPNGEIIYGDSAEGKERG